MKFFFFHIRKKLNNQARCGTKKFIILSVQLPISWHLLLKHPTMLTQFLGWIGQNLGRPTWAYDPKSHGHNPWKNMKLRNITNMFLSRKHIVWKSLKMSHLNYCHIKTNLSGNTETNTRQIRPSLVLFNRTYMGNVPKKSNKIFFHIFS